MINNALDRMMLVSISSIIDDIKFNIKRAIVHQFMIDFDYDISHCIKSYLSMYNRSKVEKKSYVDFNDKTISSIIGIVGNLKQDRNKIRWYMMIVSDLISNYAIDHGWDTWSWMHDRVSVDNVHSLFNHSLRLRLTYVEDMLYVIVN